MSRTNILIGLSQIQQPRYRPTRSIARLSKGAPEADDETYRRLGIFKKWISLILKAISPKWRHECAQV